MDIVIAGAAGRMGQTLIQAVLSADDLRLSGAFDLSGSAAIGQDAGEAVGRSTGVLVSEDYRAAIGAADCLIDFTQPEGSLKHLDACVEQGKAVVIGTTGFSADDRTRIAKAAESIPVVFAPNMAVGVNVTFKLAELAARILGEDYDVEIIEAHHRHKVDAPSGTAVRLGEVVAEARGQRLEDVARHGREGITGARDRRTIGCHAVRGGDIIGEHTVMYAGEGERVEVTVRSSSRMTYAAGALRAARFLQSRKSGLYDMWDVLGLR